MRSKQVELNKQSLNAQTAFAGYRTETKKGMFAWIIFNSGAKKTYLLGNHRSRSFSPPIGTLKADTILAFHPKLPECESQNSTRVGLTLKFTNLQNTFKKNMLQIIHIYTFILNSSKFHQKNTQTAETVHPKFRVPKNPTIFTPHMIPRRSWSAPEKGIADFIWDEALEPSEGFLP